MSADAHGSGGGIIKSIGGAIAVIGKWLIVATFAIFLLGALVKFVAFQGHDKQVADLQQQVGRLTDENKQKNDRIQQLESRLAGLTDTSTDVGKQNAQIEALRITVADQEVKLRTALAEAAAAKVSNAQLKEGNTMLTATNERLLRENDESMARVTSATEAKVKAETSLSELSTQSAEKIRELEERYTALERLAAPAIAYKRSMVTPHEIVACFMGRHNKKYNVQMRVPGTTNWLYTTSIPLTGADYVKSPVAALPAASPDEPQPLARSYQIQEAYGDREPKVSSSPTYVFDRPMTFEVTYQGRTTSFNASSCTLIFPEGADWCIRPLRPEIRR